MTGGRMEEAPFPTGVRLHGGGLMEVRAIQQDVAFEVALDLALGDMLRGLSRITPTGEQLWGALTNRVWIGPNGEREAYTFRAAGDLVAAIMREGCYLDWYCSWKPGGLVPWIGALMLWSGWRSEQSS